MDKVLTRFLIVECDVTGPYVNGIRYTHVVDAVDIDGAFARVAEVIRGRKVADDHHDGRVLLDQGVGLTAYVVSEGIITTAQDKVTFGDTMKDRPNA